MIMTNMTILLVKRSAPPGFIIRLLRMLFHIDQTDELTPEQEADLVTSAARDPQAFDELYRRYVDRVYAYHLVRTDSREEAEDLTSQTFLAALEGLPGYRRQGNFTVWLFSIARRKLVDHYRRPAPLPLDMVENLNGMLEDDVDHKLRLDAINRTLQTMDPERVEALSLRVYGQLSSAEIARLLSRSEGAVRNLVYRALQDLRKSLVPGYEMEEK
jgi:RNA polymerase sigma-70 factor (ECF subfamily)